MKLKVMFFLIIGFNAIFLSSDCMAQTPVQPVQTPAVPANAQQTVSSPDADYSKAMAAEARHDYAEDLKWCLVAAGKNYAPAMSNIGGLYFKGLGVPKDDGESYKWYSKAADQGDAMAENRRGWFYQQAADDLVFHPGTSVDGRAVSEITTNWWQWAMAIPGKESPVRDLTGSNCTNGQEGPVWFLAGGYGSAKIHRVCTIPEGKILFFPLINMAYWPQKGDSAYTCQQAKAGAALNNETAIDLFAEIDGVTIGELKQYRVSSDKCFNIFERISPDQRPYNAYPAASDGYWLSVKPLQKGAHVLKFGGKYNRNSPDYGHMVQDIEYDLIVK